MSSVFAAFDETTVVETIEVGRTYPKKAVVSYLLQKPIGQCYRKNTGGSLLECAELKRLVDEFELPELGTPRTRRYFGDDLIRAERLKSIHDRGQSEKKAS